jgi:cytochrome b561
LHTRERCCHDLTLCPPGRPVFRAAGVRRPPSLIFLHWLTFVLIAAVLGLVFVREGIDEKALRTTLINLHRSLGLCVALLAVVRIAVRLAKRPLPPTADASPLEHFVAMAVHLALYVLMFALPLIGWALSSANGKAVSFFGLFIAAAGRAGRRPGDALADYHEHAAWLLLGLSAPTRRRPWPTTSSRDGVLRAMLPAWLAGPRREPPRPRSPFSPESSRGPP